MTVKQARYRSTLITAFVSVSFLIWQWIVGPISVDFQLFFFLITLFGFGIQHGALDHLVEVEIARREKLSFDILTFLIHYALRMLLYGLLWYILPQLSFLIFILLAAWHFGETDVSSHSKSVFIVVVKFLFGLSVIGWILFSHSHEADQIIKQLLPRYTIAFHLWRTSCLYAHELEIVTGSILVSILLICGFMQQSTRQVLPVINLLVILGCCYLLPLLISFAIYFAGWHLIVTLYNIHEFIQPTTNNNYTSVHIKNLWLKALPLSLLAMLGLLIGDVLLQHYAPHIELLPIVFIFLSLITLPHMNVMHRLDEYLP